MSRHKAVKDPGVAQSFAWLDRELALSAQLHDVRSTLTALSGLVELAGDQASPALQTTTQRLVAAIVALSSGAGLVWRVEELGTPLGLEPCTVAASAPTRLLLDALGALDHRGVSIRWHEATAWLTVAGVPLIEGEGRPPRGWPPPGPDGVVPGLAGARLRTAARLCGALGQHWARGPDDRGEWLIHLRRTPP